MPSNSVVVSRRDATIAVNWRRVRALPLMLLALGCTSSPPAQPVPSAERFVMTPAAPTAGDSVDVVYRSIDALAAEPALHLRGRLRTTDGGSYSAGLGSVAVARLERADDGTFRGRFVLPDSVVFAAFAVEDAEASVVDSREGRFFELLVHDDAGRPTMDALEQRFHDWMGRDELEVLASAQAMVRHHPDDVGAWSMLRTAESWTGNESDARRAEHVATLERLGAQFATGRIAQADDVADLHWYALTLDQDALADAWLEVLLREHPDHMFAIQTALWEATSAHRDDPRAILDRAELLWQLAVDRAGRERVARSVFGRALDLGEPERIRLWAERMVASGVATRGSMASALASHDSTRAEGIRALRREIDAVRALNDDERPLGATRGEFARAVDLDVARRHASLGRALLVAGDVDGAIAALEAATRNTWSPSWLRSLGHARLDAGDTARAVDAFASVAADPGARPAEVDSLRAQLGIAQADWQARIERARAAMLALTLDEADSEPLAPFALTDSAGVEHRLADLLGERATVFVVWSRYCEPSRQAMPSVQALANRLETLDVPLVAITREDPAEAYEFLRSERLELAAFHDDGDAARALNSWGTPQFFVVDGDGFVRFAFTEPAAIERQVMALTSAL